MSRRRLRILSVAFLWLGFLISPLAGSGAADAPLNLPTSPFDILASEDLEAPFLDAVPFCEPIGLRTAADPVLDRARAGEWDDARSLLKGWMDQLEKPPMSLRILDSVLKARSATERKEMTQAELMLRDELRSSDFRDHGFCHRTELARLLMMLDREAEASAQWTLASRIAQAKGFEERVKDAIAFGRAEVLYRTGRRFDAHLGFRQLAKTENLRLAAGARLRLTDLSFDAGNVDRVSVEYETLLPRAPAFGASMSGWALRAAEAALDAGHKERSRRWLERYLDSDPDRDGRDAAEIRLADLEALSGDVEGARKRLAAVSGRRRQDRIGAVAVVRAIELGVFEGGPRQRVDILNRALRRQRHGVRRYALGVLMSELEGQGDVTGALAVATRLAYSGVDPVVTPMFPEDLDRLLSLATLDPEQTSCESVIRALGGRYGILIERSEQTKPFKRVGLCFEELELPWLASKVYLQMTRRFGTRGASTIALPLARSSLATGEITLARRMAIAALREPGPDDLDWRAILAQADFLEGRLLDAARELRIVLEAPEPKPEARGGLGFDRAKLVRLFALALTDRTNQKDLDFLSGLLPRWLEDHEWGPGAEAQLVEATLLVAHAQRGLGKSKAAKALYEQVESKATPGALLSSARFWLGQAQLEQGEPAAAWGADPEIDLGAPWSRLALFEQSYSSLENAYLEAAQSAQTGVKR